MKTKSLYSATSAQWIRLSVIALTIIVTRVSSFAAVDGPSGSGGGDTVLANQFDQQNHNSVAVDQDRVVDACGDFARSADEGLYLLEILIESSKIGNTIGRNVLPAFRPVGIDRADGVVSISEPSPAVTPANLESLRLQLKRFCANQDYQFSLSTSLVDTHGRPLVAWNLSREKNGGSLDKIILNPNRWSTESIMKTGNCSAASDSTKCVENFRRIIAAHEILSLAYSHTIEADGKYPLTSALKIFNEPCTTARHYSNIYGELILPGVRRLQALPPSQFQVPAQSSSSALVRANFEFVARTMRCDPKYIAD